MQGRPGKISPCARNNLETGKPAPNYFENFPRSAEHSSHLFGYIRKEGCGACPCRLRAHANFAAENECQCFSKMEWTPAPIESCGVRAADATAGHWSRQRYKSVPESVMESGAVRQVRSESVLSLYDVRERHIKPDVGVQSP